MNDASQRLLPSCLVMIVAVLVILSLLFIVGAVVLVLGGRLGGF